VKLAARGARDMDTGIEDIKDDPVLAQVRRQARKVNFESMVTAAVLTVLILLIPAL
jgi:hypothetical protein